MNTNYLSIFYKATIINVLFSSVLICYQWKWKHLGLGGEEIQKIVIDTTNPNIIYAGSKSNFSEGKVGNLFKSTNGGISWDTIFKSLNISDIDIHPQYPNIVFVVSAVNALNPTGIYKTTDSGKSWKRSDSGITRLPWSGPNILQFNYAFPETIYAGTSGDDGGAAYRSVDGGLYWSKLLPIEYFDGGISMISFNPKNSNEIFIGEGYQTTLYYTSDGGGTWKNRGSKNEVLFTMGFHKNGRIFLGTSALFTVSIVGLFFSDDTFKTWNHFNPGFTKSPTHIRQSLVSGDTLYLLGTDDLYRISSDSNLYKFDLDGHKCKDFSICDNIIYIGTENGVYRQDITTIVESETNHKKENSFVFQNYPNPFNSNTIIKFYLNDNGRTSLELYDILGKKLGTMYNQYSYRGEHTINIEYNFLKKISSSGIYFISLFQNGRLVDTKKMVLMK